MGRGREEVDQPTEKRTRVVPFTQQPTTMPSRTARTWLRRCISTNSALVSCMQSAGLAAAQGGEEENARGSPSRLP